MGACSSRTVRFKWVGGIGWALNAEGSVEVLNKCLINYQILKNLWPVDEELLAEWKLLPLCCWTGVGWSRAAVVFVYSSMPRGSRSAPAMMLSRLGGAQADSIQFVEGETLLGVGVFCCCWWWWCRKLACKALKFFKIIFYNFASKFTGPAAEGISEELISPIAACPVLRSRVA